VANRAVDPMSKLSAAEWASHDAAVPGLGVMDDDQAYRAMDLLAEADTQAEIQEAVFFAAAHLLNLEVDVLLFDTTNTYFEIDEEDEFRRRGPSKHHREDLPQISIGLAVTKEGIPVRCWCWSGNTTDMTVITEVKDSMRQWRLGRVITVVDRGFSSEENLGYLTRAGGHYIAGERMRSGAPLVEQALSRQGRYQQVRDNLKVKEVKLDGSPGRRWIICLNPVEAERDKQRRDQAIADVETELARIETMRRKAAGAAARRRAQGKQPIRGEPAHVKAECALRDHDSLGRWVRQLTSGRLVLDKAKIAAEARLDGKYLLSTSDPDLTPEEIALGYKNLLEAEHCFRAMKSRQRISLRPIYHRLDHRIRGHVLLCWLALLLTRTAERRTDMTWHRIATELDRLHAVTLTGPDGSAVHTTTLNPIQSRILTACQVPPPPAITRLIPA
jgi:transposase